MAEDEKEKTMWDWANILVPRILIAMTMGFLMGGEMLLIMSLPQIGGMFAQILPEKYTIVTYFFAVCIMMEVTIQLLNGTIFPHVIRFARVLISMYVLILVTNEGEFSIPFSQIMGGQMPSGMSITFSIDFRVALSIFLLLAIISLIKNMLQAVNFLSEKAEEPMIPPELP